MKAGASGETEADTSHLEFIFSNGEHTINRACSSEQIMLCINSITFISKPYDRLSEYQKFCVEKM